MPINRLMNRDSNMLSNGLLIVSSPLQRTIQPRGRDLKAIGVRDGIKDIKRPTKRMVKPLTILNPNPSLFRDKHSNDRPGSFALTLHFDDFKPEGLGDRPGNALHVTPHPVRITVSVHVILPSKQSVGNGQAKKSGPPPTSTTSSLYQVSIPKSKAMCPWREDRGLP